MTWIYWFLSDQRFDSLPYWTSSLLWSNEKLLNQWFINNFQTIGNNTKKAQKHQNTFAFKHNKNSMLTRKIRETPLDNLCKRCLEKLEWRINFRKYKPLTSPGKCIKCEGRNVYKAYRQICDSCGITNKLCTKCMAPTDEYAK